MRVELASISSPVSDGDLTFIVSCLNELFDRIDDHKTDLRPYLDATLADGHTEMLAIVADAEKVGLITLVRFAMPRYLGFGYEIQELVILQPHRGKGVARRALELVAEHCRKNPRARKVLIRTNVPAAKRAYASVWQESDLSAFQTLLNLL
jgi:GNAT superfamily N-acetyltransferase